MEDFVSVDVILVPVALLEAATAVIEIWFLERP
jgi:hypothetical protein